MSLPSILNSVQNYLTSNYMYVDQGWLSDCVSYLLENNLNEQEIQAQAKEQWLLNNLKDICPGCLVPNIKNIDKIVLSGRYVLQINAAVDIGTPAYQQYLKLKKVNTENIEATMKFEEKLSCHRMIKLYMTDGVQEVTGMEYKPMRNLSLDITPGSKVLIKGPVECRHGMLLLTENCIELLGGEVEEMVIKNSQAGLLSTKLGIEQASNVDVTRSPPRNVNVPTLHTEIPPMIDQMQNEPTIDFAFDKIDMDQLDIIEAQFSDNSIKRASDSEIINPEKKIKVTVTSSNDYDDYPNEGEMFSEDEEHLREMEANFDARENELYANTSKVSSIASSQVSNIVSPEPFVYIKQINDLDINERLGEVFKVKAQIMKILSKLTVGKEGWSLCCTIVDGTGNLDVDFSSDVLSKLVGFTPQEMTKMKKQMATNPDLKENVVLALQNVRNELQVLYCIMEIVIMEKPTITQLIPFESYHVEDLKKRLQDSRL